MSPMTDELRREVRQLIDEAVRGTVDVRNHLQTQIQLEMIEAKLANLDGGEQGVDAGGGGTEYVAGDDTLVVFTPVTDTDSDDYGKTRLDVYYK